jgi:hypothetical protein
MALAVLEAQGPIRDDALVREIARAHGFARTGNRIKQRVLELLPDVTVPDDKKPVGKPQRYEVTTPPVKVQVVLEEEGK